MMELSINRKTLFVILFFTGYSCCGQDSAALPSNIDSLYKQYVLKLDSVANSNSIASHFCKFCRISARNVTEIVKNKDSIFTRFMTLISIRFNQYLLEPAIASNGGKLENSSAWQTYFSHPDARSWQLVIAGANAHINGDLWKCIVRDFSANEILENKKAFLKARKIISRTYIAFFDSLAEQNRLFRFMNDFTKGSPRLAGTILINKWRNRQMRLAIYYYRDKIKFDRLLARISRKKNNIDNLLFKKFAPKKSSASNALFLPAFKQTYLCWQDYKM